MQVSLDGGATWIDAPQGVRVDVETPTDEDEGQSMVFNFTNEGLIVDLYASGDVGECLETIGIRTYDSKDHIFKQAMY